MQITFTSEETRLLIGHLNKQIEHMDDELVHTDKRELQRSLAAELEALRALAERIDAGASLADETTSGAV